MVAKKRGLGRGLSALIPDEPIEEILNMEEEKGNIINVDIDHIKANEDQARKEFDETSLNELSESIKNYGVIQPIIVRKVKNEYEIIAGERRWRASKEAGLKEIPCIVKDVEELEATKLSLIENLQREDLNPIEEAIAYKGLMEKYNFTQENISKVVGKSRPYVANSIRLLNLDEAIIKQIAEGKISSGHGRALLSIDDKKTQLKVVDDVVNKNLNVRETEEVVKNIKEKKKKSRNKKEIKDPFVIEVEENLMRLLGTKVQILPKKDKGKIEIEYYSDEDLERLVEIISKE